MKLDQLYENTASDFYKIMDVRRSDDWGSGTSKKGTLNATYAQLVGLFGKPEVFTHENRDVNAEWCLDITYQDKANTDPEDTESVFVSIWDKNYGEEYSDPSKVTNWIVNAKTGQAVWVLEEVIAKGIKATA